MKDIPVRDMEAWVNRPPETRQKEAEKRNGYITRPMNSFMLYRSAYAERTKQWCLQNNHQVVSSVSGESWPMEPQDIRNMYNEYARIERMNHQRAHPDYKFSPSKPGGAGRKRKGIFSDEDGSELSDLEDPDAEWVLPSKQRGGSKGPNKKQNRKTEESVDVTLNENPHTADYMVNEVEAWTIYEGKPLPAAMSAPLYDTSPYYDGEIQHHSALLGYDTIAQYGMFTSSQPLISLPGGQHRELFHVNPVTGTPLPYEPQVDPTLLDYSTQSLNDSHESPIAHIPQFGVALHCDISNRNVNGEMSPGFGSEYYENPWEPSDMMLHPELDPESELNKWL
jgi:hypothetical protein